MLLNRLRNQEYGIISDTGMFKIIAVPQNAGNMTA